MLNAKNYILEANPIIEEHLFRTFIVSGKSKDIQLEDNSNPTMTDRLVHPE